MSTFTVGCFAQLQPALNRQTELAVYSDAVYLFQNFYINQTTAYDGKLYTFAPFSFSGVTVNRTGDNLEASLIFANNELTRSWADRAIRERWLITVDVVAVEADSPGTATVNDRVHSYVGQATGGAWKSAQLDLKLGTVLDAVGADVPRRNLTQDYVGKLPTSSNVNLQ
jgi:hypothetical protein|tara:strand:- start:11258 stop:11764 length:507 start_codon:yes stop_codon:yes gene_type:complete